MIAATSSHRMYDAFISYSHIRDAPVAPRLQSALHHIAKPWYKLRALHVFRDETNLSATPELWSSIQKALDSAQYFILLASPQAAQSKWVRREVDHWLAARPGEQILIVLTDGEILWDGNKNDFDWNRTTALPENLRGVFEQEPLWVDFRELRTHKELILKNPIFMAAVGRLAAPLRGMSLEQLISEDRRQHSNTIRIASIAVIALFVLTVLSVGMFIRAKQERDRAVDAELATKQALIQVNEEKKNVERELYLNTVALAATKIHSGEIDGALDLLWDAPTERRSWEWGWLLKLVTHDLVKMEGETAGVLSLALSRDGSHLAAGLSEDAPRIWDVQTGHELKRLQCSKCDIPAIAFSPDGSTVVTGGNDNIVKLWNIQTGRNRRRWLVMLAP